MNGGRTISADSRLSLDEVQARVLKVVSWQLGVRRSDLHPRLRLIEDLHCDSLDAIELFMEIEDEFGINLPDDSSDPVYKSVFTRAPFRIGDLAEMVYLHQLAATDGVGHWTGAPAVVEHVARVPFTQLGGRWEDERSEPLYQKLPSGANGAMYRRRSDGMRCIFLPAATVEIGSPPGNTPADEHPAHTVDLRGFLIDAEPVSTTAFCRFLNSIGDVPDDVLREWFVLAPEDDRRQHMPVARTDSGWQPLPGTDDWPMILVSWYGANAYSLWANRRDWRGHRDESAAESCLPSEAQWEYAARGPKHRRYPWGDEPATPSRMRYAMHRRGAHYTVNTLPLAPVNERSGVSPFGLHHMAGNIWQWCCDWYSPDFYGTTGAAARDAVNRTPTGIRSERGGSWIGSPDLCRSSYRRGRTPSARGRCLGFRCVGSL